MLNQNTDSSNAFRLNDFFLVLWKRKQIVLGGTATALLLGVVYVLATPKIYQVHSKVAANKMSKFGLPVSEKVTRLIDLPGRFVTVALSESFRREFFQKHALYNEITGKDAASASAREVDSVFRKSFDTQIQIQDRPERSGPAWLLTLSGRDPVKAAQWLNAFVDEANVRATQLEAESVQTLLTRLGKGLEQRTKSQLEAARELEKLRREYQLARLKTAHSIAKKMGLTQPVAGFAQSTDAAGNPVEYFRGTRALEAEIAVLQSEKEVTPDPYDVDTLTDWQEMSAVKLDPEGVKAVEVVSQANANYEPTKPHVFVTLLLALFVGFFVASLGVLIPQFFTLITPLAE